MPALEPGTPLAFWDDQVFGLNPGNRVRGWAVDLAAPTTPVAIHGYLGGLFGSGSGFLITPNDVPRPDVATAFADQGVGPNQGFNTPIPTATFQTVTCLFAINAVGTGSNRFLGCSLVDPSPPA